VHAAPDWFNIDLTLAHDVGATPWGRWGLGLVAYGGWDLQNTVLTRENGGPGHAIGGGGSASSAPTLERRS